VRAVFVVKGVGLPFVIKGGLTGFAVDPGSTNKYISATLGSVDGVSTCRVVGAAVVVVVVVVGAVVVGAVVVGAVVVAAPPLCRRERRERKLLELREYLRGIFYFYTVF